MKIDSIDSMQGIKNLRCWWSFFIVCGLVSHLNKLDDDFDESEVAYESLGILRAV